MCQRAQPVRSKALSALSFVQVITKGKEAAVATWRKGWNYRSGKEQKYKTCQKGVDLDRGRQAGSEATARLLHKFDLHVVVHAGRLSRRGLGYEGCFCQQRVSKESTALPVVASTWQKVCDVNALMDQVCVSQLPLGRCFTIKHVRKFRFISTYQNILGCFRFTCQKKNALPENIENSLVESVFASRFTHGFGRCGGRWARPICR